LHREAFKARAKITNSHRSSVAFNQRKEEERAEKALLRVKIVKKHSTIDLSF
jgi:hypothetical protein